MGFGWPVIKEGLILVISIVTLQNCFGDLGEICGKYPRWLKVPGPLDIDPFWPSSLFHSRILIYMGFWGGGAVIKEGIILVISIVTLQNCFGDLGEICGKYPRWLKVPGPLDIGPFLTQFPILFGYIDLYGFWGARYKRGYNFSYLDCYTPKLFWRPRWDVWQVLKMAESTGTSWYWTLFDPVHYSIYIYWYIWVLGAPYKIGSNFSYLNC